MELSIQIHVFKSWFKLIKEAAIRYFCQTFRRWGWWSRWWLERRSRGNSGFCVGTVRVILLSHGTLASQCLVLPLGKHRKCKQWRLEIRVHIV